MAARENQGLQIALIIFVMLTIILSVTTYIFFDNYKKAIGEKNDAIAKAKEADNRLTKVNLEREGYFKLIDQKDIEESAESIVKKNEAKIEKYLALSGVNTQLKSYPEILKQMAETLQQKDIKLASHKDGEDKAVAELAAVKAKHETELANAKNDTTKAQSDYTTYSGTIKTALAALGQSKLEAEKAIKEKGDENIVLNDKIAAITKKATVVEKGLLVTVGNQKKIIDSHRDETPTLTDGQIVYVDERTKSAYVNIGRTDSLQRRVTFSVYDRGTNDVATAVKKGAIEIIEIIDDKISRARIVENSVSDPILPGDFIDSPLWYPGKRLKIAIAGAVDFDNDGISDRAKLKDLIIANGGTVVADVSERGEVMGAITPDTEKLIVGRGPDDRSDAKFTKPWNEVTADAKKYNIKFQSLQQFLDEVGYSPNSNRSQDAGNQRLVDTLPKPKDNQTQIVPRFPPRSAPAGSGNSAFQK